MQLRTNARLRSSYTFPLDCQGWKYFKTKRWCLWNQI